MRPFRCTNMNPLNPVMKKNILRIAVFSLLATALAVAPTQTLAQEKKDPPAAEKKQGNPPVRGKLAAVDKAAKTITIGQTTIQITADTKFQKAGKDATLDDAVVGEEAMATGKKKEDGKFVAKMVRFGPKPEGEAKGAGKKKKKEQ